MWLTTILHVVGQIQCFLVIAVLFVFIDLIISVFPNFDLARIDKKMTMENNWQLFAKEISGKYIEGIAWHSDRTEIYYKQFLIIFEDYTLWSEDKNHTLTRARMPYFSNQNFRFEIYRNGIIRSIEKLFGAQDIKIGIAEFDKSFIIKSNDDFKISTFLQDDKIRNLIEMQHDVNILVSDRRGIWEEKLSENEFELCYYSENVITDINQLKKIYQLFQTMIDKLIAMKSITVKINR